MTVLTMEMEQKLQVSLALSSLCLAATADNCTNVPECAVEGPFGRFTLGRVTHFVDATLASVSSGPQAVIGCFGLVCGRNTEGPDARWETADKWL